MDIGPDQYEQPANLGFSDCKPTSRTSCFPDHFGVEIIVEGKIPDDPYYDDNHDADCLDIIDDAPLHSGKYFLLTPRCSADLEPYAYWCSIDSDADKRTILTVIGPTTPDDSINDLVNWIRAHFENLNHYWTPQQAYEIKKSVLWCVERL